jgi:hypothetical protein
MTACTATQPNATTPPLGAASPAPPAIDPSVAAFLAANNASFELQEPPATVAVSAARALEIVAAQTKGPIREARVLFGLLHANLGAIAPPHAWLVLLVGPGFEPPLTAGFPPAPPSALASQARAANLFFVWAFVDSDRGTVLMSFGSGPP